MDIEKLPGDTLWQLLHSLPVKTRRRLRVRLRGTKLEWLLQKLLTMKRYNPAALRRAYKRAFPTSDPTLLRIYKYQLWSVLQSALPEIDSPIVGREVQIWQRFWISMILWHMGLEEAALTFWQRAMQAAVEAGWYELALWGFSLLEIYLQGSHFWIAPEIVSAWSERLLELITMRYRSIAAKLSATKNWFLPSEAQSISLPPMPETDAWALCMQAYERLIHASSEKDLESGLGSVVEILEILLFRVGFSDVYVKIHLANALVALGSFLVHLRQEEWYRRWRVLWEQLWRRKVWLPIMRYEELHLYAQSLEFSLKVLLARWNLAYAFWQGNRDLLQRLILHTNQSLSIRFRLAWQVYWILVLKDDREAKPWEKTITTWLQTAAFRESGLLWWYWLRWYEAHRKKDIRRTRRRYRQALSLWKRQFIADTRWEVLLRWMRASSYGLPHTQRKRLQALYQARNQWKEHEVLFPVSRVLEALFQHRSLEGVVLPPPVSLSAEVQSRMENIFQFMSSNIPSQTEI